MKRVLVVSSANDFKALLQPSQEQRLLLCLELPPGESASEDVAVAECPLATSIANELKLHLYAWNAGATGMADARKSLDISALPSLFVIRNGEFLDKLHGEQVHDEEKLRVFLKRVRDAADGKKMITTVPSDSDGALQVDIGRMLQMGKNLMAKSSPEYAEKFFLKALGVLDAMAPEMGQIGHEVDDVHASMALCLAWVVLAQLVRGRSNPGSNEHLRRLKSDFFLKWTSVPMSEEMRSVVTGTLFMYAPVTWTSAACSQAKLTAALSSDPTDDRSRSLLVITLFLAGDIERCITEALKLHVRHSEFGSIALNEVCRFLGSDHPLVVRTGWKVTSR